MACQCMHFFSCSAPAAAALQDRATGYKIYALPGRLASLLGGGSLMPSAQPALFAKWCRVDRTHACCVHGLRMTSCCLRAKPAAAEPNSSVLWTQTVQATYYQVTVYR